MMSSVLRHNARLNAASRGNWDVYAEHRRAVTHLIGSIKTAGSICVLGAGNCNDIDLRQLTTRGEEVHLYDIDRDALEYAASVPGVNASALRIHGGIDLSGIAHVLDCWAEQAPSDGEIDLCIHKAQAPPEIGIRGTFDLVVSVGLLTQLIGAIVLRLGHHHPRLPELTLAVRDAHLRLIVGLTRPCGTGLLITDIVSSDTVPTLRDVEAADLPSLLAGLLEQKNFFTGANPVAMVRKCTSDNWIAPTLSKIQLTSPWRWDLGQRSYMCCGLLLGRNDQPCGWNSIAS